LVRLEMVGVERLHARLWAQDGTDKTRVGHGYG